MDQKNADDAVARIHAAAARERAANARLARLRSGVEPLSERTRGPASGAGGARAEWERLIAERIARGMARSRAVALVAKEYPGLREAVVAEANANSW